MWQRAHRSSDERRRRVGWLSVRRGHARLLAGLLTLLLVLAACGPDEPDVADEPEQPDEVPEEVPEDPEEVAEFPSIVDGVLQPHPATGFPSGPITLWQPFEPGSDDDVFNQQIARIAAQYSPVPIATDTQQMGPALTYELSDWLQDQPGSDEGYHIYAVSWFGQTTRLFTQEAMAGIACEDLYQRLNPVNQMTFAPYSFLAPPDGEFQSIQDVEAYLAENPGGLTISSSSPGGGIHTSTLVWADQAGGLEFVYLPTDSPAEARTVLLGGGSDIATSRTEPGLDEEFTFLMVTGDDRLAMFPDVPAAGEFGYSIPGGTSRGYGTLPGVPDENIDWLFELLRLVNEDPEFEELFGDLDTTYRDRDYVEGSRQAVIDHYVPVLEGEGVIVRDDRC